MADAVSKVSSKYQTVIPKTVRERLALQTGDVLRFHVADSGIVTIEKVEAREDDPFTTFAEWKSDEDDRLYRDL